MKKKKRAIKIAKIVAGVCVIGATVYFGWNEFLKTAVPYSYRGSLSDIIEALLPMPSGGRVDAIHKVLVVIESKLGIPHMGRMVNGVWI